MFPGDLVLLYKADTLDCISSRIPSCASKDRIIVSTLVVAAVFEI